MANPDSLGTLIRLAIVKVVQPHPSVGEAWCIACSKNGGRTAVYMAESIENHVRTEHAGEEQVMIDVRWRSTKSLRVT